jgi:hypothetical protein
MSSNYQQLIDETILTHDVNQIQVGNKEYNVKIILSDHDLIDRAFEELKALQAWNDNEEIESCIENGEIATPAKVVRGTHPALHYRGNALKRHKIWFQKEGKHYLVYKYTGWQWKVLNATFKITSEKFPALWKLVEELRESTGVVSNHWIMTLYENGLDYIGMHSDKMITWRQGSSFIVQKWGHPRLFQIALQDEQETIIFNKILPPGTKIIIDDATNLLTRHGVPTMPPEKYGSIGPSGSIVGRDIEMEVDFITANREIAKSIKAAKQRKEKKEEKRAKKRKRDGEGDGGSSSTTLAQHHP